METSDIQYKHYTNAVAATLTTSRHYGEKQTSI